MTKLNIEKKFVQSALTAFFALLLPNVTLAVEKTVNVHFQPPLYISGFQSIDVVSELRYNGHQIKEDAVVRRVDLLIKARNRGAEVSLDTIMDSGYPTSLSQSVDFEYDDISTFQRILLSVPHGGYGRDDERGNQGARLLLKGVIKIASMQVTVDERPDPTIAHLESFKPSLGTFDTETIRVGYGIGRVQQIFLSVDKRHIEINRFIVVLENGRELRVREFEGRVRQNSSLTFDVERRRGLRIDEIVVEAKTIEGQGGPARVDVSVLHEPTF